MTINLPDERIIPGTVAVRSASSDGIDYRAVADFRVEHRPGTLIPLAGGDISDAETLEISYSYKPSGRFESSTFSGDPLTDQRVDDASLTTEEACQQRAKRIVERDSGATLSARVDLSALDPGTSTLAAIGVAALPDGIGPLPVQEIEQRIPSGAVLRLGEDVSVSDRQRQLDQRDETAERRV